MTLRGLFVCERSDCRGAVRSLGAGLSLLTVAGASGWQDGSSAFDLRQRWVDAGPSREAVERLSMQELVEAAKREIARPLGVETRFTAELSKRLKDPVWADRVRQTLQAEIDSGAGVVRSSPRWFEGQPYAVQFRIPEWLSGYWVTATVVSPADLAGEKLTAWTQDSDFEKLENPYAKSIAD